jgi:hypothetical protein
VESDKATAELKVGGFVAITAEAVAKAVMTPVNLLKVGWPNKFLVLEIYDNATRGKLVRLDPCCGWMLDPAKEGETACEAHPAKYFSPLPGSINDQAEEAGGTAEPEEGARRYSGFGRQEGGEDAVGMEYVNAGKDPASFFFRRAGTSPVVLRGAAAERIKEILSKFGVL